MFGRSTCEIIIVVWGRLSYIIKVADVRRFSVKGSKYRVLSYNETSFLKKKARGDNRAPQFGFRPPAKALFGEAG